MIMKRFFSTFFLLWVVASSLVITNDLLKEDEKQLAVNEQQELVQSHELERSIDLTEADIFQSEIIPPHLSLPN